MSASLLYICMVHVDRRYKRYARAPPLSCPLGTTTTAGRCSCCIYVSIPAPPDV
jgi:hypothetical protein